MNVPKNKRRCRKANATSLRDLMAQPPACFYRLPDLSLRGGYLTTDGCRRVLDFAAEIIRLDMGGFLVTLYGSELRIESLVGKRLVLAGRIGSIVFQSKGEEPHREK